MYLHIGSNYLIPKSEVIAILNVPSLQMDAKGKRQLEELRKNESVTDISEGKWASVIMADSGLYVSRISSSTLLGRSMESLEAVVSAKSPGKKKAAGKKDAALSSAKGEESLEPDDDLALEEEDGGLPL